jgi:hypothetical protein
MTKIAGSGSESGSVSIIQRHGSADPDSLFSGMDPRIRIDTKISWIRSTAYRCQYLYSKNLHYGTGTLVLTESLDHLEEETDIEGLRSSAKTVYSIIEDEIRAGIPSNKIIIGGFSQGTSAQSGPF